MKKIILLCATVLCLCGHSVADVFVKDIDGTKAELIFTIRNPSATEMNVIGSFNDWTEPGIRMSKNADGLWEVSITAGMKDEIKYKFFSKGQYIADARPPAKIDDGFGGSNGLVIPADALATQALGETAASGDIAAIEAITSFAPETAASGPRINFTTWSLFGVESDFITQSVADPAKKGLETNYVQLKAKSYNKFSGELIPNMPFFIEIALFEDNAPRLYEMGPTGEVTIKPEDSIPALLLGLFTNPVNYLNGNKADAAFLGHLKFGVDTPYINWVTGYKYAKLPANASILWRTIEDWDAGYDKVGGFNQFSLGSALQHIGDVKLNVVFAPNRSADRAGNKYGVYSYLNADWNGIKGEFQYNASFENTDIKKLFDHVNEQDFIIGTVLPLNSLISLPITIKGQMLFNTFHGLDFAFDKNVAAELRADYGDANALFFVEGRYRFRGEKTHMLYTQKVTDDLGDAGKQRVTFNFNVKPLDLLKIGVDSEFTFATKNIDTSAQELYFKPWTDVSLTDFIGFDTKISLYSKMNYNLLKDATYAASNSAFLLSEIGFKASVKDLGPVSNLTVWYAFDNSNQNQLFNSLIAQATLPANFTAELGLGFYTYKSETADSAFNKDKVNPFAFVVGTSYKLPTAKKSIAYAQFVYNMDPYKDFGDGQDNLNLDASSIDRDVGFRSGSAQLRVGMRFDF